MAKLGDLTLDIILNVSEAEKGAKIVTTSLKGVDDITQRVTRSASDLSGRLGRLGLALNGVKDVGNILKSSLSAIFNTIRSSNDAYQNYLSSTRQLQATAKLTGANLDTLNKISEQTKNQFSLTAGQANLFSIELTKLGQKAGDVSKVQESINALMDLGAGQGLTAEQSLYAIKQAILGIDEGTDKLFQKNPSVIYDEYAKSIGTTAGKLTDQQKAQALLNAVLTSGNKLTGSYSDYLNSAAGKQQALNSKLEEAKQKLGEQLQPVLLTFLGHVNSLLSYFTSLSPSTQKWIIILGTMGLTVGKLIPLIVTFKDSFGGLSKSILSLGKDAPGAFDKVAKSGISTFGKGGLLAGALLVTLGLIESILDKIDEVQRERNKLLQQPTPPPSVPPGFKSKDGVLVPDTSTPTMDWDLIKKNSLKNSEEQNKLTEEQKKSNTEVEKTIDVNKKVSGSNRQLKDTYKELKEEVRTFGDLIKELNGERTIGELTDRLLRQKEIDDSTGSVRGFYGPDDKNKRAVELKRKEEAGKIPETVEKSLSFAQQLTGILGLGADNFAVKFLGSLQEGLSLANSFAQLLSLILGSGSGGIFSLLGLASGGSVPGSGSGDSVPAMLTPGEFVVKKSIVDKIGSGFFDWINGGGMMSRLTGRFATGGLVTGSSGGVQVVVLDTKISGKDISLSQRRTNKTDNRRKF